MSSGKSDGSRGEGVSLPISCEGKPSAAKMGTKGDEVENDEEPQDRSNDDDSIIGNHKKKATSKKEHKLEGSDSDEEFSGNWSPPMQEAEDDRMPSAAASIKSKPCNNNKNVSKRTSVRERMEKARDNAKSSVDDDSDNENNQNVSIEELKQKILGRSIPSMYDVNNEARAFDSGDNSRMILDPSAFADGTTVADHLRQDVSCAVCHDRFYNPVSLMCGHTFCQRCLKWWLDQLGIGREEVEDDANDEVDVVVKGGTCPSCRRVILGQQPDNMLPVNTALKACMDAIYGKEMNQRRLAEEREQRKTTSGEKGGIHQRGCEELVALPEEDEVAWGKDGMKDEENGWASLYASTSESGLQRDGPGYSRGRGAKLSIRRNIVLDDTDQRFQLSLGFTRCAFTKGSGGGILDVELCLLAMEEDEVGDSGFPALVLEGSDDEPLICAGNDRIHTCIESSARVVPVSALEDANKTESVFGKEPAEPKITEVPLTRGMIRPDGSVRFRIDVRRVLENATRVGDNPKLQLVKLRFCHDDTGAVLELRLPTRNNADTSDNESDEDGEEVEFGGTRKCKDGNDPSRFILDVDGDEEELEGPNEYEEDGFVVGSQETEEGDSDERSDDSEGCFVCTKGGDLIVCDGGDNEGGCGNSYHIECIKRSMVPPGDWICSICANEIGFEVGIEGYEYDAQDSDEVVEIDESDDDSSIDALPKVNAGRKTNALSDEDSDVEIVAAPPRPAKRQIVDSDSDSENSDVGKKKRARIK